MLRLQAALVFAFFVGGPTAALVSACARDAGSSPGSDAAADVATDDTAAADAAPGDTTVAEDATPDVAAADTEVPADTLAPADTATPGPWDGPVEPPGQPGVTDGRGTYLATHTSCALCHGTSSVANTLHDAAGRPIGMYLLWRSSMMANAARDPFWRAMVSAEAARRPAAAAAIEAKCLRCHAPALAAERELTDGADPAMADLAADGLTGNLARDGVTCTVCHQLEPDDFGAESSFDGHFEVNPRREISAPHDGLVPGPMANVSGYTPVPRDHMRDSGLCATCHTLRTGTLDADGLPEGHTLVEQSPYLEWRNSVFTTEGVPGAKAASCQACHVPTLDADGEPIKTKVATTPGGGSYPPGVARTPVGRHLLVGGNTLIGGMFRDHQALLNPEVPADAFATTVAAARRQLEQDTARVELLAAVQEGSTLSVHVRVTNLTGHKLPTGYPSRRLWVALTARTAAGAVALAVGAHDADGRLVDQAGAPLPSELPGGAPLPHGDHVTSPDDVVVYEVIMADSDGAPTWSLMGAASYLKDNRLLPEGYSAAHPDAAATAPAGLGGDADFTGGHDEVHYTLVLPAGLQVAEVEASLRYQTLAPRFAAELFRVRTEAVAHFEWFYLQADKSPVVVATDTRGL